MSYIILDRQSGKALTGADGAVWTLSSEQFAQDKIRELLEKSPQRSFQLYKLDRTYTAKVEVLSV